MNRRHHNRSDQNNNDHLQDGFLQEGDALPHAVTAEPEPFEPPTPSCTKVFRRWLLFEKLKSSRCFG